MKIESLKRVALRAMEESVHHLPLGKRFILLVCPTKYGLSTFSALDGQTGRQCVQVSDLAGARDEMTSPNRGRYAGIVVVSNGQNGSSYIKHLSSFRLPVIVLSGKPNPAEEEECMEAGAVYYGDKLDYAGMKRVTKYLLGHTGSKLLRANNFPE